MLMLPKHQNQANLNFYRSHSSRLNRVVVASQIGMALNIVIHALVTIIALAYYFVKRQYNFFKVRGIPYVKPKFPLGNLQGVSTKHPIAETLQRCYHELKHQGSPIGGVFFLTSPTVLAMDLNLLRNIFVKDFQHFYDRGMYVNERDEPLSAHLFNLEGTKWRNLRNKLSPTFTSGKMRMMFPTMMNVVNRFHEHLAEQAKDGKVDVELKELLAQFTTDIIGNTAFGIECNTIKEPNNEFRKQGKRVFENNPLQVLRVIFILSFQKLARKLRMRFLPEGTNEFFMQLLKDTIQYRDANNVQRNDFLSLLMQIKNTGRIEGDTTDLGKMTFNELAAQVFLFFIAGFETSSSTMTFAFYELALNPDIQKRARDEIREVLSRYEGKWTYEAVMELTFVEQIIHGEQTSE